MLIAFAPGTGRNLYVNTGDPGNHNNGTPLAAVTTVTTGREPATRAMIEAYDKAGGGAAGEKAAEAIYQTAANDVVEATIALGPNATKRNKLHELGHIEQALNDPEEFKRQSDEARYAPTHEEYEESESEIYADQFAEEALKDEPDRPTE